MKVVRINEGNNINFQGENRQSSIKGTNNAIKSDEIMIKIKFQDFPNSIKEEMKIVQKDMSVIQAKLEAVSQLSKLLKNSQNLEEISTSIKDIYDRARYEGLYLLENIKEDLFSNDVPRILQVIEKELQDLVSRFEESKRNINALLVKFQNIATFIESVSNEQIDGTIRLISKLNDQGIFKITPQNVMKFLSN